MRGFATGVGSKADIGAAAGPPGRARGMERMLAMIAEVGRLFSPFHAPPDAPPESQTPAKPL